MSFVVERCTDAQFIDKLFDELRFEITLDNWPSPPSADTMLTLPGVWFLSIREDGRPPEGAFMFTGDTVHTLFLPSLRGGRAVRAGRAAAQWVWEHTDKSEIRSYFYSHRPDVRVFAKLLGFTEGPTRDDGATIAGKPTLRTDILLARPTKCPQSPH